MDFNQALQLLNEAQGDPARLALATVEIVLASQPAAEQEALRAALEAAAIPHWFDAELLGGILDEPLKPRAAELAGKLRALPFVESFAARGEGAANVHEATRLALRARLAKDERERLRELSRRATAILPSPEDETAAPHLRIEALFHLLSGGEEIAAAEACHNLYFAFTHAGNHEAQQALGVMLAETVEAGVAEGLARAEALLRLAIVRFDHQSVRKTEAQLREALDLSETANDEYWISATLDNLARLLATQGRRDEALTFQRRALEVRQRQLKQDPSNLVLLRCVGISHSAIGDLLLEDGDETGALAAFRESEKIGRRGVEESRGDAQWRRDLSVSLDRIGDVLHRQRQFPEALVAYREGEGIRLELAEASPDNSEFQRDLAISYRKIGDTLRAQDDLEGALASYRQDATVTTRMATADPGNAQWQDDLATSHDRLGNISVRLSQWAEAGVAFRQELELARAWLAREETSVDWYNTFAIAAGKLWQVLRDAPAGAVEIDRAALLADLHQARALLLERRDAGRLRPPGDKNLPWIESLLQQAGDESEKK